ncbi:hypothetical protein QYF36_022823 [Acer negundo]|nr:hypothetical protein QYF36_022823 [Acer negundo]
MLCETLYIGIFGIRLLIIRVCCFYIQHCVHEARGVSDGEGRLINRCFSSHGRWVEHWVYKWLLVLDVDC